MDPSDPEHNLMVADDVLPTDRPYRLLANLLRGQFYVLSVTTRLPLTIGRFFVTTVGPQSIHFTAINPTTSRPVPITSKSIRSQLTTSFKIFSL